MKILFTFPFAFLFFIAIKTRLFLYKIKILKSYKLKQKVISIGNLTMGGAGKTPLVSAILKLNKKHSINTAVLTRGYKRKSNSITEVKLNDSVFEVGDEPLWLKNNHEDTQVIVGADRVKASNLINKNVEVLLLDDGFQHFRIERDRDIVLFDATQSIYNLRLFPIGFAREPLSHVTRAHAVVITKSNLAKAEEVLRLKNILLKYKPKKLFELEYELSSCIEYKTQNPFMIDDKKVILLSGIANPLSFERLLVNKNVQIVKHIIYEDHHEYTKQDVDNILKYTHLADCVVTTEKDAVKLKNLYLNFVVAKLEVKLTNEFEQWLKF